MIIKEPPRNVDPGKFHPVFRVKHDELEKRLAAEGLPFRLFEGHRSGERQGWLYAQGRTRLVDAKGKKLPIITKAAPGESYHEYGLAGDWVLWISGKNGKPGWSWDTSRQNIGKWKRLQEIGFEVGLEPISWELPHLQVAGLKIADLKAGKLPPLEITAVERLIS